MKDYTKEIESRFGKDAGLKVPKGYFEQTFKEISDSLPEYKVPEKPVLTRWQRIKPYVYLAAMFAGIWCMMKMFHMASDSAMIDMNNPPALVAEAIDNHSFMEEATAMTEDDMAYFDFEESVIDDYKNMNDFEKDFEKVLE